MNELIPDEPPVHDTLTFEYIPPDHETMAPVSLILDTETVVMGVGSVITDDKLVVVPATSLEL
jgi:hypothetical protein